MEVSVLGAGAMGSALTIPLYDNDHDVNLWGSEFDESIMTALRNGEEHPRIGVDIPEAVNLLDPEELEEAVSRAEILVLGVSSNGVVPVSKRIAPYLDKDVTIVSIAKGLVEYEDQPWLIQEGIHEVLQSEGVTHDPSVVCVGGPSIAMELAERSRTAVAYACSDREALDETADVFETEYYSITTTTDVSGLEVCIGFKNAYSISLAWPDGLTEREHKESPSNMTNLKAIFFLQTMNELQVLAECAGGEARTVRGLAGLGDLVTTSSSGRNGTFGRLLGSGKSVSEALDELERQGVGVIEGYETAQLGLELARTLTKDSDGSMNQLPLLREINEVLYEGKPVREAIEAISI